MSMARDRRVNHGAVDLTAVSLGGFLGRRDDASPIHQCPLSADCVAKVVLHRWTKTFAGCRRGFRVKICGTSSPRAKLTGNFANAAEVTRIVHRFVLRVLAKNSWRCNFRLLQHYPPQAPIP